MIVSATGDHRSLCVESVGVRFGGLSAIQDVSFTISPLEIFGLIGPNGAGKTTLVNCLSGFQRPTEGRVLVDGRSTEGWTAQRFRHEGISRTFQAGRLFKAMTAADNVEVAAVSIGLSRRQARVHALEVLSMLGIAAIADKVAGTLPYTDERRVGIARALVMSPSFILLDEPAAGMSDHECDELMVIIAAIPRNHGCGVLLIEHNMSLIMRTCERIHVLDGGRTLAEGAPSDVRQNESVITAYLGSDA